MSAEGLIISILLALVTLAGLATPFRKNKRVETDEHAYQRQRETLLTYYNQIVSSIRDLEEDFANGKFSQSDYEAERETWIQRGIPILQAIDELDKTQKPIANAKLEQAERALDDKIESAIKQYLEKQTV